MTLFVTVLHVVVCIFLIIVVLLQRGKGAEVEAICRPQIMPPCSHH